MLGEHNKSELFAVLVAWRAVRQAGWPQLAPAFAQRSGQWARMDEAALRAEVQALLDELSRPSETVRLFWKFAPGLEYRGFNRLFLKDSGVATAEELMGETDISPVVGWSRQGAKYRADDMDVIAAAHGVKDIIERQDQADDTVWLHTAKCAICLPGGEAIGILGMYEVIDGATAARLQRRIR